MNIAGIVPWQNTACRAEGRRDFGAGYSISHAVSETIKSGPAPSARPPHRSLRRRCDRWRTQFTAGAGVRRGAVAWTLTSFLIQAPESK
jgi:hypothetical protein